MADTFDTCLAFTLREEGGYMDDPADPGGATNMGITLATYRQWSDNSDLGPIQVQDMTERTARAIYRTLYWNPLRADALPAGVDLSVFDMGVNAGIWGSARLLQRALGFTGEEVDGCIGPETLGAAAKCNARTLVNDLADRQSAYYRPLPDFPTFGTGWLNRTEARQVGPIVVERPQLARDGVGRRDPRRPGRMAAQHLQLRGDDTGGVEHEGGDGLLELAGPSGQCLGNRL